MFLTQLWDNLLKRIAIVLEKTSTDNKITRLVWSYRQIMTPGRLRHATTTITTFVATRISSYYVTVFFRAFRFRLAWFLRLCSLYYHWSVSLTLWVYSWSDEVLIAEFLTEDLRVGFFFWCFVWPQVFEIYLKLMMSKMESLSILIMCSWPCLKVCAFDFISITEWFRYFIRNHILMT